MIWRPVLLLAILLVGSFPVNGEETRSTVVTDDSGDVMIESADGSVSQADPTGNYGNVDVVAAGIWAEDDELLTFFINLDSLTEASQTPLPFSDPDYYVYFRYGEQGYRVMVATSLENPVNQAFGRSAAFARLEMQVNAFQYRGIAEGTTEMQYSENQVLVSVPRGAIVDHNTAPLARNATLHNIFVESSSMGWFGFPIGTSQDGATQVGIPHAFDRAPNADGGSYIMSTGTVQQRGKLFAVSDDPVRWTNGEATTINFQSTLTNLATEDLSVSVAVDGTPASWEVAFADRITVPASTSVNVTVLVSIPFSHAHGSTELFEVRFATDGGDHEATAALGVHWPFVPQPAGHHNTLWLHSLAQSPPAPFDTVFAGTHAWFSALEELEEDEAQPIAPAFTQMPGFFGAQEGAAYWFLSMEPGLRMGLNFEPGDLGLMEAAFNLPVPVVDPRVEVTMYQQIIRNTGRDGFGGNNFEVRETLVEGSSVAGSGAASGPFSAEVELAVAPGVDDLAYNPDANLGILISLKGTFLFGPGFVNPETLVPTLLTTTQFNLPLNEYHDPANLVFQTDSTVVINVPETGQERFVNPGRTVVYEFDLDYTGAAPTTFRAELTGKNLEWGTIIGDQEFTLTAGESRSLAVAVTAPETARDGEQADLTLTITSKANAAVQAGIRTLTTVTSGEDIPDESDQMQALQGTLTDDKDSPALPLLLLVGLLLAIARRKQ